MNRYLRRALLGHLRASKSLYLLAVGGVALGVAAVLAIQILNQNALAAFAGGVRAIGGDADLVVVGTTPSFADSLYPRVLADPEVAAAWPLVRVDAALADEPTSFLEVVGVDLFAPVRLPAGERADSAAAVAGGFSPAAVLGRRGWVAVSPELAAERGWQPGDTVTVSSGSRRAPLVIGALVDFRRHAPLASRRLALMDISQAQALLGRDGRLEQIDLRLVPGADPEAAAARLSARLAPAARAVTPEQRRTEAAGLLAAFRLNLTALSLISLLVGLFLVYSSVQASLVRRRREFGLLRSLGATRRQVLRLILVEAALLGLAGTAVGLPLGWWAASRNVEAVSGTLTSIYLLREIESLRLSPWLVLLATAIGAGGAVLGALLPALEIARRDPKALLSAFTLHERAGRLTPRLAWAAVLLAGLTWLWYAAWGHGARWSGFAIGLVMLAALTLLAPLLLRTVCGRLPVRGLGPAYSLRNLTLRLQTTAVAAAALGVAISMLFGVTLMVGSFRSTLRTWIDVSIRADVYVTTDTWVRSGGEAAIAPDIVRDLCGRPEVLDCEPLRQTTVRIGGRPVEIAGIAPPTRVPRPIPLLAGDPARALAGLRGGEALVSEPLARRLGLGPGDTITVPTPTGPRRLAVAAVSLDYGEEHGAMLTSLATLEALFGPGPPGAVALYLRPGVDAGRAVQALKAAYAGTPLWIRSNRDLRRDILAIFEQTFAVTRLLQLMALLIAACGVALTLIVLARERLGELALYRALGATRRQVFGIFLGEGLGLGLMGLLLGAGGGVGLALLLIYRINRDYFGWTIRPAWPAGEIAGETAVVLLVAAAASLYPALRASRTTAAELSREDV